MFMDAEEIIKLLDSRWFEHQIFKKQPNSLVSTCSEPNPDHKNDEKQQISRLPSILTRSMSHDQLISSFKSGLLSPDSVLNLTPKLHTIVSGKEISEDNLKTEEEGTRKTKKVARRRESKSLSDLEFEELKGFMDLGFVFSEEDKDSSLASIIPGLQRLGKTEQEDHNVVAAEVSRPYLSEAWEELDRKEEEKNPLVNWRVPSFSNEMKVKDNLKWWAHAVATTVIK